jgi:hypothetical protein
LTDLRFTRWLLKATLKVEKSSATDGDASWEQKAFNTLKDRDTAMVANYDDDINALLTFVRNLPFCSNIWVLDKA